VTASHHVRLTNHEIKELLLQTAIHSGVAVANSAFQIAQRMLPEQGRG
jgi:alkylhydroperoxidase/carboxymuconolactone decarboxylase family protein YurZ